MRTLALTTASAGITRQRDRGGARPDTLYDLTNAYAQAAGNIRPRFGTVLVHTLPSGTKGLTAFAGKLHVFAESYVDPESADFTINVLAHPTDADVSLFEVHFAQPFLGFLYVAAEFANGDVYHYWLQNSGTWEAETVYCDGDMILPTVENGLAYRPTRTTDDAPQWQADVPRQIGERISPTTDSCFEFEVVEVIGDDPRSGETEPVWPTEEGAEVWEDTNIPYEPPPTPAATSSDTPPSVRTRYASGRLQP